MTIPSTYSYTIQSIYPNNLSKKIKYFCNQFFLCIFTIGNIAVTL